MLNCFSHLQLFVTPWTLDPQAPLPMVFSRQEYWSGFPCSPPRDLSDSGIKPASLRSCALVGVFFTTNATWEVHLLDSNYYRGTWHGYCPQDHKDLNVTEATEQEHIKSWLNFQHEVSLYHLKHQTQNLENSRHSVNHCQNKQRLHYQISCPTILLS